MSAGRLVKPTPRTAAEKIREFEQRIRELETKQSQRIGGEWVLTAHPDTGDPILVKPGVAKALDGSDVSVDAEVIDLATRGYVTKADTALAVSGGQTQNLSVATEVQVQKDVATGTAQSTADNALAQAAQALAALESGPGGVAYNDSFDGDEATDLGPLYDKFHSSGSNDWGLTGLGTAGMVGAIDGATNEEWYYRRNTAVNTGRQRISATWETSPRAGQGAHLNAQLRLFGREARAVPTVLDARWQATIEHNRCRIGYYTSDLESSYVPLTDAGDVDGWKGCTTADGDSWDFWIGLGDTGHDRYKCALLRNNLTVATADDIPENTVALLANRYGGIGVRTAVVVFWYLTQTVAAPTLQAINIADRQVA